MVLLDDRDHSQTTAPALAGRQAPCSASAGTRAQFGPRLEIFTVEDLLLHRPRRYEDRRHFRPIAELQLDEPQLPGDSIIAQGVKMVSQA